MLKWTPELSQAARQVQTGMLTGYCIVALCQTILGIAALLNCLVHGGCQGRGLLEGNVVVRLLLDGIFLYVIPDVHTFGDSRFE